MKKSEGLLEELSEELEVLFLSDLRMPCYRKGLTDKLSAVRAEEYSLSEWRDAIQYLLGMKESPVRDVGEAKTFLLEQLKK